jgi:diguanylate cyclase (GGDEF)-like protein
VVRGEPFVVGNRVMQIQGTIQDITERRRIEEQIRFLSYYDPLTHLPNRKLFNEILGQDMAYCDQNNAILASLFIGMDRFKAINESLGGSVGDQLVKQFAERLVNETLGSDYVTDYTDYNINEMIVSRLSGSEFNLLINKLKDTRDILNTVKDVFRIVEKPFIIEKHQIFLSISIGVVVYPGDATDEDSLIKNGRFVMGYARERGENNYEFFSESLNVAAFHKLSMVNSLRQAIEQDELLLYYHARIDMLQNRVIGCEALIRWQHPDLGLVSPTQFIPIAEDAGLMSYISSWVLESACKQMRDWRLQNIPLQIMAVNVSAAQFRQPNFAEQVEQLLARQELAPEHLKIELTESILLEGIKNDLETVKKLNAIGVKVSIDDFGTGFSSLAYLKKLPISELKIDRSFIRDIPNNPDDMAITQAILALAKSLALDVVAEGVENQGQIDFLIANGCKLAQGFFYCRPVQSDEFPSVVLQFNS